MCSDTFLKFVVLTISNACFQSSSLGTQKFGHHLTVHCLIFYELVGIPSRDDSLRLRRLVEIVSNAGPLNRSLSKLWRRAAPPNRKGRETRDRTVKKRDRSDVERALQL